MKLTKDRKHWQDHQADTTWLRTAADVIDRGMGMPGLSPEEGGADSIYVTVCGSCGHRFQALHEGWEYSSEHSPPDHLTESYCPQCESNCFRDAIIIKKKQNGDITTPRLQRFILNRLDDLAWKGQMAHPEVHKTALREIGINWNVSCPCCGETQGEFHYHHWEYEGEERGVQLCSECHLDLVHDGMRASEKQREIESQDNGLEDWRDLAAMRLMVHCDAIDTSEGRVPFGLQLHQRFNIPMGMIPDEFF